MLFGSIIGLFSNDIGIDLGTANTLVHVRGEGIVLSEPSVVAIQRDSRAVLAVGEEAKRMLGRTPADIVAIRPLKDGVIADFEITERMIRHFITKVHNRRALVRPRIVIGVPSGITEVERRAVREAAEQAGAREVYLIEEPMAAAIGANICVHEPAGNLIIDIGGGTTEVAVISLGGMVVSKSIRIAGNEMDEAIVSYVKKTHSLLIGERTSEEIKIKIGSAYPLPEEQAMEVKGRDTMTGLPRTLRLTSEEIREALKEPVSFIVEIVKTALEETPPELASDIVDRGIVMAGGGALLRELDRLISQETRLPVVLADDPLRCVVIGTGKYLDELKHFQLARKSGGYNWSGSFGNMDEKM
ncbi:rod shape-determining protein [Candidatus Desantisbacteria bacterium CG_4_9_14_3_um_filter_40_11]|uniref:Cell shape-determining protein MreB n=4 Tax=unclassified Candidatus Desantisiibacteriota TaxID=3106372 RepID=A0A2M7JA27_9BACT|nr:MAG: rod shape-determining protein [Candidatus Desantisbacteria bacterium CG23_combo_of_CG06-09_8_20_14_all_40_23]PIX16259.1 MAG: rod shape-determining protein [Candidatus Desantisbacteria bacterium CG_4_8_14_3_um_filter_40_12]PIY19672.1 MAG: rod shape-determining protein [Candidatus Desantisbacteria bacterium CG_4_10_14_3_um_filter_40_18]PJB29075.1 MAG: rod shape-determining protein [Candidatus Desantisbacteria bacterium CG_4_9_14_3_um_filter_40_11]